MHTFNYSYPSYTDQARLDFEYHRLLRDLLASSDFKNYGTEVDGLLYAKDPRYYMVNSEHGILQPFVKHINYDFAQAVLNLRNKYGQDMFSDIVYRLFVEIFATSVHDLTFLLTRMYNIESGCQLQTDKLISDELLFASHEGFETMSDIPWFHHRVVEFFFDCSDLPTLLSYRGNPNFLLQFFGLNFGTMPIYGASGDEAFEEDTILFFAETPSLGLATFVVDSTTMGNLLNLDSSDIPCRESHDTLSQTEFEGLGSVIKICLSSMIHAHAEPKSLESNPNKKSLGLGKPNVKGRPNGSKYRVMYVPRINYINNNDKPSNSRNFYGRCCVYRKYRHDRYAKSGLQGQTRYIPPVLGANGENPHEKKNVKYRLHKRETGYNI